MNCLFEEYEQITANGESFPVKVSAHYDRTLQLLVVDGVILAPADQLPELKRTQRTTQTVLTRAAACRLALKIADAWYARLRAQCATTHA